MFALVPLFLVSTTLSPIYHQSCTYKSLMRPAVGQWAATNQSSSSAICSCCPKCGIFAGANEYGI